MFAAGVVPMTEAEVRTTGRQGGDGRPTLGPETTRSPANQPGFSCRRGAMQSDGSHRQETQIVQSQLDLYDSLP